MSVHVKREDGKPKCGARSWGLYGLPARLASETTPANCRRCLGTVNRKPSPGVTKNYVGAILRTSWGYDMTFNEYCKVVSQTPKSVEVVKLATVTNGQEGGPGGTGKAQPGEPTGETFRLFPRGENYFRGGGFGWSVWSGQPNYENHVD